MAPIHSLDDVLELADLLTPWWAHISANIPSWHPRNAGSESGEGSGESTGGSEGGGGESTGGSEGGGGESTGGSEGGGGESTGGSEGGGGESTGGSEGGGGDGTGGQNDPAYLKRQSRKHERRAKEERRLREETERKLLEREEADKTEEQKKIDAARQEGEQAASAKYEAERRADRLELAVTRHATTGVKIGTGDKAQTVKFADPDDAIVHLERAIARKDVDPDDIFDAEGKVKKDGLATALAEILEDKPHLRARPANAGSGDGAAAGDAGAGRGQGAGGRKDLEEMSPADHYKAVRKS